MGEMTIWDTIRSHVAALGLARVSVGRAAVRAMPPEVAKYWNAKKTLALMDRAKGTPFGALQVMLAEEEGR